MSKGRAGLLNVLTIVVLAAMLCLVGFYCLMALGMIQIFAPPTPAAVALLPTSTPTPRTTPIPTWTPTVVPPPTEPGPPTDTPGPSPTPSNTPTFPPSPTFPPTATPTPRVTRSPWPFTYEASLRSPEYGCGWTGVAGQVQDLDGNPFKGYPVHVWGAGLDFVVTAGADDRFNTIYGSEASWEQFFAPSPKPIEIHVQLHDPYRQDHPPVSDEIVIDLPGTCSTALAYVIFTQNH